MNFEQPLGFMKKTLRIFEGIVPDVVPENISFRPDEDRGMHRTGLEVIENSVGAENIDFGIGKNGKGESGFVAGIHFRLRSQHFFKAFRGIDAHGDDLNPGFGKGGEKWLEGVELLEAKRALNTQEKIEKDRTTPVLTERTGFAESVFQLKVRCLWCFPRDGACIFRRVGQFRLRRGEHPVFRQFQLPGQWGDFLKYGKIGISKTRVGAETPVDRKEGFPLMTGLHGQSAIFGRREPLIREGFECLFDSMECFSLPSRNFEKSHFGESRQRDVLQ